APPQAAARRGRRLFAARGCTFASVAGTSGGGTGLRPEGGCLPPAALRATPPEDISVNWKARGGSGGDDGAHEAGKQGGAIGIAVGSLAGALGVGHHAEHPAVLAQDAGDVLGGAVGVFGIGEGDAVLGLKA